MVALGLHRGSQLGMIGTLGRKTEAVSPRLRARTKRADRLGEEERVDGGLTHRRRRTTGDVDASDTIARRRASDFRGRGIPSIRVLAPESSESTTVGFSPVIVSRCRRRGRRSGWTR